MKNLNKVFIISAIGLSSLWTSVGSADDCTECVARYPDAITECVNDFLLDHDTCEHLLKTGICRHRCPDTKKLKIIPAL